VSTADDQARRGRTAEALHDLYLAATSLLAAIAQTEPDEIARARGHVDRSTELHRLKDRIDSLLWTFDLVQTAAGLRHPHATRHRHFLTGAAR
jgi:hypothetical protein